MTARRFWIRAAGVSGVVLVGRIAAGSVLPAFAHAAQTLDLPGEVAGALISGVTLAWLAQRVQGSTWSRTSAIGLVAFISVAAVMIEGSAFAPLLSPPSRLAVTLPLQLLVYASAAGVAVMAVPTPQLAAASSVAGPRRLIAGAVAASAIYVGAYLVTGSLNYLLVTGPYYKSHAGGLTTPEPSVVIVVALAEGLMLALAAVPLARALPGSTRARALGCGIALWLLGGLVPLLQAATLPDVLRVASAVEILFQKVPLGVAVVWFCAPAAVRRLGLGR